MGPPPARPSFPATRVRLATVAARYSWNFVLARPKWRDWQMPKWTSRANLCSSTTLRSLYWSYPVPCCNARACCNRGSWGWISTHRPFLPLAETHWNRSGQVIHSDPSNWKARNWWTRPMPSVRFPAGTMVWVSRPAGQVQLPAARSMIKSSLGKRCRSGRPGTRATTGQPVTPAVPRDPFLGSAKPPPVKPFVQGSS